MNKNLVLQKLLEQLEIELQSLKLATQATYDAATNEESKPENEYDTRALEASYLAGAQAKRLLDMEELIFLFRNISMKTFSQEDSIEPTALVQLESRGQRLHVLIMPKGGGMKLTVDGISLQILTPASPLGEALMGLGVGDVAQVEDKLTTRDYQVVSLN